MLTTPQNQSNFCPRCGSDIIPGAVICAECREICSARAIILSVAGLAIVVVCAIGCASVGTYTSPDNKVYTTRVTGDAEYNLKVKADGSVETSIKRKPLVRIPDLPDITTK